MGAANKFPRLYCDTHAGRGVYDLTCAEAQKISEYETGITRIDPSRLPKNFKPYARAIKSYTEPLYPGSAGCISALRQGQDKLHLFELHKGEVKFLRRAYNGARHIVIEQKDGHAHVVDALTQYNGVSPLVLIDPSYEVKTEYAQTAQTARNILASSPNAVVVIWYPVLAGAPRYDALLSGLEGLSCIHSVMDAPFDPLPEKGMIRTGLVIFNAPEGVSHKVETMTELLTRILKTKGD